MRCFPCHTPHEIGPRQKGARKKFDGWKEQYGDRMLIFKKTPEATLQYLIDRSQQANEDSLPLLNLADPAKSLLVLKPMSKIPPKDGDKRLDPTYKEPVFHGGGLKIHKDDHSYKAFLSWLEDFARTTKGQYAKIEDLPADNWFPTPRVLRMKNVPEAWAVGLPVQLFVFAKKPGETVWSSDPVAFTQGTITPRRIVNGPLILFGAVKKNDGGEGKDRNRRLPKGDYLVKVHIDTDSILQEDPAAFLPDRNCVGQVELKNAEWRVGFPKAEWIDANDLESEPQP